MEQNEQKVRRAIKSVEVERDPQDPLDFLFDSEYELPPESVGVQSESLQDIHQKVKNSLVTPEIKEEMRKEREQHRQWREQLQEKIRKLNQE